MNDFFNDNIDFKTIFEKAAAGLFIFEIDTRRILEVNPYVTKWLGYEYNEILDLTIDDLFGTFMLYIQDDIIKASEQDLGQIKEGQCYKKDGTLVDVAVTGNTFRFRKRECILIFSRDISKRKQADKALQEQLHFLQRLIDTIPNPIFYKDTNAIYQYCNIAFETYVGLTKEEIVGKSDFDIAPKDLADIYYAKDLALFREPGVQVYEASVMYADGTRHDVIFNMATYSNTNGIVAGLVGVIIDITERKRSGEALLTSEERYRMLFNSANDAVFVFGLTNDIPGKFIEANDIACKRLGYTREEVLKLSPLDIVAPEKLVDISANIKKLIADKHVLFETVHLTKDGSKIPVEINAHLFDFKGQPTVLCIDRDITERIQAEEKLRTAHQQLLDIIEFLPDATVVIDHDKKVIAWNRAMEEMTGIRKEDIIGKGDYAYAIPFYGCSRPILVDLIFSNDWESELEYEHVERKGNVLFAEAFAPSAFNGKGAFVWATASPLFDSNVFLTAKNYRIKRQISHKELPGAFPSDKIKKCFPDFWRNQIKGETLFT